MSITRILLNIFKRYSHQLSTLNKTHPNYI